MNPFLNALMELSISDKKDLSIEMQKVVDTIENVTLPTDFWDELKSHVGSTDEIFENNKLLEQLIQFQHHAEHKRTTELIQSYKRYNSMISLEAHDQGSNAYTCWAFSAASMIRNSCLIMINNLKQEGLLSESAHQSCLDFINHRSFHVETRNSILMILVPRQLHVDDESQAAFLRAAVSRLANETIIDREGIFYLNRVTDLVGWHGLDLSDFPVNVTYKTYYNRHHPHYQADLKPLIEEAVEKQLCPVAAVDYSAFIPAIPVGTGSHAMVLDTIHENNFIFKNTYAENKQVWIPVDKGPLEFYYVHIDLTEEGFDELRTKVA